MVPVDVEGSAAGLFAAAGSEDASAAPPLVPVDALVSVPPPASVGAGDGLDPEPPPPLPVALPVLAGAGALGLAGAEPEAGAEAEAEAEAGGLDGLGVVGVPLPPEEPPDAVALPEAVGLGDGLGGGGVELGVAPAAGGAGVMPAWGLPAALEGASVLAPGVADAAEPEVDPTEPNGVADDAEAGLPSGVVVTVSGAPVTGARADGVPAVAADPAAEAS